MKDYEFQLSHVRQQFEDIDGQFTDLKQQEIQERMKLVNINGPNHDLNEIANQLHQWRDQVQHFR